MEEQIYSNKFVCFAFAESEVILTFHQIHSGEKSLTYYASKYPMTVELKLLRDEPL